MSLRHCGSVIAWYIVVLLMLLTLYSHTLTVTFGSQFDAFVEFFRSFYYVFGMLLGKNILIKTHIYTKNKREK